MLYGVSFYPEQKDKQELQHDIQLLEESGINTVRMGEFAWCRFEPEEGEFHFTWLDEVVEELGKKGIQTIICTPTACPPAWMVEKYPEILYVDNRGITRPFGGRRHYCYNSEIYRRYSGRIAEKITEHYGKNPYVAGFQIDNELAQEGTGRCRCAVCRKKFQSYMRDKYHTVEELNRRIGGVFWSGEYSDFSQIEIPVNTIEVGTTQQIEAFYENPSVRLDFERFADESLREYQDIQKKVMKAYTDKPVTTNGTGLATNSIDYYKGFRDLDVYAFDYYPELRDSKVDTFPYAFGRGIKQGQNFWVMEFMSGGGHRFSGSGRRQPNPGALKKAVFQAFANGAGGMLHFQFRTFPFGAEQLNYAIVDADGVPRRRYYEMQETARLLRKIEKYETAEFKNETAICLDYETCWALRIKPVNDPAFEYLRYCRETYQLLEAQGIQADVISVKEDITPYKTVILPSAFILDEQDKERLKTYVQNGGNLVATFLSSVKNRDNIGYTETLPAGLTDVFGVEVEEVEPVFESNHANIKLELDGKYLEGQDGIWCDLLGGTAKMIGSYKDSYKAGKGIASENCFGEGHAYYIGTALSAELMEELLVWICDKAGVRKHPFQKKNEVEVVTRFYEGRPVYFFTNQSGKAADIALEECYEECIEGKQLQEKLHLDSQGIVVLTPAVAGGLKINHEKNPIGIQKIEQVSWILQSEEKNIKQMSYRIQIAQDEEFARPVYDSGTICSEESAHVRIGETGLKPVQKYYLRVYVTDSTGRSGCLKGHFVTALHREEEWKGDFITVETEAEKEKSQSFYVRGEFQAKGKIKSAYVMSTALGVYHVYLNGEKIGEDELTPGWTSYRKHLRYQMYDVKEMLRQGKNVIGALVGAGWYKGKMGFLLRRNNYGTRSAFSCQLFIEYENGETEIIKTDTSWRGHKGPILFSEIYDGEYYDAREEIEGWNKTECNCEKWEFVRKVSWDVQTLKPQIGAKVKCMEKIPAKRIFTTPAGETVVDFGQNLTGWIACRVKGKRGDKVELNCFEVLDREGNVYQENLRTAKQTVTYVLKDDKEVVFYPNFTYQGFQYAKITSYPGIPKVSDFTACVLYSEMEHTGNFHCSNEDINQLQHNILWGMKGNFLDIPTDCPQRDERAGWTGDVQIFCGTSCYLMDTYVFYRKWLCDLKADQREDGGVPHVIPDFIGDCPGEDWLLSQGTHSAAAWADVAVVLPWTLYRIYGDIQILEEQYESMKKWIQFMERHSEDYIWNYRLQFGDWVALDAKEGSYFGATPNELTCTAYFAYSTGLMEKISTILEKTEDAAYYRHLYDNIAEKYQRSFFDETGHLTAQTQTAQIITLQFGLAPEEYRENVQQDLLRLLQKENGHLVTGFVGTPYFCHVLSEAGYIKEAYELLLKEDFPSWLYQVKNGATTIWEHWDGKKPDGTMWSPDMNSFNHYAYGAVGEWLYRAVAGINVAEDGAGYKKILIRPYIGGKLSYARASFRSVYGKIESCWREENGIVTLRIRIPANTTAQIRLEQATEIVKSREIELKPSKEGYTGACGSGTYTIVYRI